MPIIVLPSFNENISHYMVWSEKNKDYAYLDIRSGNPMPSRAEFPLSPIS